LLRRERSYHIATKRFDLAGVHATTSVRIVHSVESTALEI